MGHRCGVSRPVNATPLRGRRELGRDFAQGWWAKSAIDPLAQPVGAGFAFQHPQVGLPSMIPEQRVVVGAEITRKRLLRNYSIEHPAQRQAVHIANVDSKSDDSPCELVHDDHYPMRPQHDRFAAEQVDAPQTVFGMTYRG